MRIIFCISIISMCGCFSETFGQKEKTLQENDVMLMLAYDMYKFRHIKDALKIYLEIVEEDPDNAAVNVMVGLCYLKTVDKGKAVPYLKKANYLNPLILRYLAQLIEFSDEEFEMITSTNYILYLIAKAYHLSHNFDKAIEYYEHYNNDVLQRDLFKPGHKTGKKSELLNKINRNIYECNNGKEFVKYPISALINNIGVLINTPYSEYIPLISANDSVLIFTSRRIGGVGSNRFVDHGFYEDIYISRKKGNYWTKPQNMGSNINTTLHDACIALSPDASQLFVYKTSRSGDIYLSDLKKNSWSNPKRLSKQINSKFTEPSISVTADGNTLYFSSTKPDIYGDLDIFVSFRKKNGKWEKPARLGPEINTEYDEDAPFILPDGKTLYFSSRGHKGMGDYDVFRTILDENGKWSMPENVGYPINTADYDIYFVFSKDGKRGYFSSYRKGGYGEQDIYVVNMPDFFALFSRGFGNNDSLALIAIIKSYGVESKTLTNEIVLNDILGAEKAKKMAQYLEIRKLKPSEVKELEKEFLQKDSIEKLYVVIKEGDDIKVMEEEEFQQEQKQKAAIAFETKQSLDTSAVTSQKGTASPPEADRNDNVQSRGEFIFGCHYRLWMIDKSMISDEGAYVVDGITIGYYDLVGVFNFIKLSDDEILRLSPPEGSMLSEGRELRIYGITIGYYDENGEFHYSDLSAEQVRKLSSLEAPILTPERKFVAGGVTIGKYNEKGKFDFARLSSDQIKKLTENSILTSDHKYIVDDIIVGQYNEKGKFKFARLSEDEITRISKQQENLILTEDNKYVVYGITIGYYDKQGEFRLSNLANDEIEELKSTKMTMITNDKYIIDEITVGCYDDMGEFKYVKLSSEQIKWITSTEDADITADRKYILDLAAFVEKEEIREIEEIEEKEEIKEIEEIREIEEIKEIEAIGEKEEKEEKDGKEDGKALPSGRFWGADGTVIACEEVGKSITFDNIHFDINSYSLNTAAFKELNYLKEVLSACDEINITITGHTDDAGTASYNRSLSEKRARSVYDHLLTEGVGSDNLTYKGYGEENPLISNDTEENRQLNRRVEIEILNF